MKRALRFVKQLLLGLSILAVLALGTIFLLSEQQLRRTYDVEGVAVPVPTDAASIAEGQRLAVLRGCYDGCHGDGFGGGWFLDEPFPMNVLLGRWAAPDLTALADARSDAELERSIRHGVDDNGRSVMGMPSDMFAHLSDEDLGLILAALRAAPLADGPGGTRRLGPMARFFMVNGEFPVIAAGIDHAAPPLPRTPTTSRELGRYLAITSCTECHGQNLQGFLAAGPIAAVPPLAVVAGYSRADFDRLMTTGVPASGLELDLMRAVAIGRFVHFTEAERNALYGYLNDASTWASLQGDGPE